MNFKALLLFFCSVVAFAAPWIEPGYFSEISAFENEWCGKNAVAGSSVTHVCLGRARVQNSFTVRSLVFILRDGTKELHLEKDPPAVELPVQDFAILGPVNKSEIFSEIGTVSITIDTNGAADSIDSWSPRLGSVRGFC